MTSRKRIKTYMLNVSIGIKHGMAGLQRKYEA